MSTTIAMERRSELILVVTRHVLCSEFTGFAARDIDDYPNFSLFYCGVKVLVGLTQYPRICTALQKNFMLLNLSKQHSEDDADDDLQAKFSANVYIVIPIATRGTR